MAMTKSTMRKRLEEAQKKISAVSMQFSPTFRNNFSINDRNKMLKIIDDLEKLLMKLK